MKKLILFLMTVLALGQAFAQIPRENRGLERFSSAESRGEACFHYAEAQKTTLEKEQYCAQLLSAMSLDEKISLLQHRNPPIERLGLRGYSWWNEALHGVGRNGYANVYPTPIALAATFDTALIRKIYHQIALEAVGKYARYVKEHPMSEAAADYAGITFFTPNINIIRDPRWGRSMETWSEDPCLTAMMGSACVEGLQSRDENGGLLTAACLKHFAAHSGPEGGRHSFDAEVSERDLRETYLRAFEYVVKHTDIQQVMCGYNRLNGEPCCTSNYLLDEVLRGEWGYRNMVVTDCWALNDCWERDSITPRHETHATAIEAAADAFNGPVDLECGSGLEALKMAVEQGLISEEKINEHVRRVLLTRLRVGTDDGRRAACEWPVSPESLDIYGCMESLVLLKNENHLLPLRIEQKVALAGPNMYDTLMPLGNYNGTPWSLTTLAEGLEKTATIVPVGQSDIVIYAGGLTPQLEGEELQVEQEGFYKGDRTRIELPRNQIEEIKALKAQGKKVVLILCCGSSIGLEEILDDVAAVVVAWYGGQAMGDAVASALYNQYFSGWGRLPVTFYRSTSQLPDFKDYAMEGRTYRYLKEAPLFDFGYGLNYGDFMYFGERFNREKMVVKCMLLNHGPYDAEEVVQVYMQTENSPKSMIAFKRVFAAAGAIEQVEIPIDPEWLKTYDKSTHKMESPRKGASITLLVGKSSNDKDLKKIVFEY